MTKQRFKPTLILWVDLEMTGLDPEHDRILEVGAIITDWNFKTVATFEGVVKVDKKIIQSRMVGEFWDEFSSVRDELIAQNESGEPCSMVEQNLIDFINDNISLQDQVLLAGNSIHQDRRFIASEWKRLDSRLHYRMLDVSAWKVVFEGKYNKKYAKPEAHRALDDIQGSIEELKYYLKKVKS